MRRVLAIGWDRAQLLDVVSECEDASIRLVCHERSNTLSPDLDGHFELILINGVASLSAYQKIEVLLDCDASTSYLFESEDSDPAVLKQFVQDNFLWSSGSISTRKIQQCLANRDKLEWKASRNESAHQNFRSYLKLFHKTVSHEFYTPVNVIKTSMHLMENYSDRLSGQEQKQQLDFIKDGADRLERLICDIRLYSEFTNNASERLLSSVNLDELIGSVCINLRETTPLAKGRLHFNPADNGQALVVDTRLFAEALKRIVQNALENSDDSVHITAEPKVDHVSIAVTDSGEGIAGTDFDNIFVPYSRGGAIDSKQGLGLGLPIARHCIEKHEGEILVDSTLGKGSTFTIKLPLEIEPDTPDISDK